MKNRALVLARAEPGIRINVSFEEPVLVLVDQLTGVNSVQNVPRAIINAVIPELVLENARSYAFVRYIVLLGQNHPEVDCVAGVRIGNEGGIQSVTESPVVVCLNLRGLVHVPAYLASQCNINHHEE